MNIPKGEFDAYIFDHDVTLSLSMHVHFDGWIESFRKNGGNFEFTREIAQSYAGVGMHDTVKILNDRFGCEMDPEQVVLDQENYFFNTKELSPTIRWLILQKTVKPKVNQLRWLRVE